MDFALSDEQRLVVDTVRGFVDRELLPHEEAVEQAGLLADDLIAELRTRAQAQGLYAMNMPEAIGGGGLDTLTLTLAEKAIGRTAYALQLALYRPSNILQACVGEQVERYLLPTVQGKRLECLAMTEPGAGSDLRSMQCTARADGSDFVIDGTKHFISHADVADYVILFAATGSDDTPRGPRKRITAFLVDRDEPGFTIREGYRNVSHRGYHNCVLEFEACRLPATAVLGEVDQGFEVANDWLGATRLQVAATCLGRAERAMEHALEWAGTREQFGQTIGKFQGVGFKLADMALEMRSAELLTLEAAWKHDRGEMADMDAALAKLAATEMLGRVADEAIQIHGGMGLMADLPLERIWRDARIERIWEGTSEIQRLIISRALLRPIEGR